MMTTEEQVLRLEAKLGSLATTGHTAMVCFYVRGQADDLAMLGRAGGADLILGVVILREVATADGATTE